MDPESPLLEAAAHGVAEASDLESALHAVVSPLRTRFMLWHASIASHPAGAPEFTVLAAWSVTDSVFEAGTRVSSSISPLVKAMLDTLREGRMASFSAGSDRESLVDHLLSEQGIASALLIPLHVDEEALLVLTLGSSASDVFEATGGFFSRLVAGIRDQILRLATAPNV